MLIGFKVGDVKSLCIDLEKKQVKFYKKLAVEPFAKHGIRRFIKLINMGYKSSGYIIQSNYGTKGNFEVVPVEGGKLQHWYRDNDSLYRDSYCSIIHL